LEKVILISTRSIGDFKTKWEYLNFEFEKIHIGGNETFNIFFFETIFNAEIEIDNNITECLMKLEVESWSDIENLYDKFEENKRKIGIEEIIRKTSNYINSDENNEELIDFALHIYRIKNTNIFLYYCFPHKINKTTSNAKLKYFKNIVEVVKKEIKVESSFSFILHDKDLVGNDTHISNGFYNNCSELSDTQKYFGEEFVKIQSILSTNQTGDKINVCLYTHKTDSNIYELLFHKETKIEAIKNVNDFNEYIDSFIFKNIEHKKQLEKLLEGNNKYRFDNINLNFGIRNGK